MLLFLYGADTYRSRQQMRKMIDKFKVDRDPQGYNVMRIDVGTERHPERVMSEIATAPFLAERRMIIVESLLASRHVDTMKELLARLEQGALPETNVVLFWEAGATFKLKDAKALFERLAKEKYAQSFEALQGPKLAGWLMSEAVARGGVLEPDAASLIAAGSLDTWAASSTLDALIGYRNTDPIRTADARLFLPQTGDDNIFSLVDALVAGRFREAEAMMQEQYRRGEDAQYVFAMVLRQYRILLDMRDLFGREEGLTSDAAAQALSIHPFVAKKTFPLMRQYSMEHLRRAYMDLLELDKGIKTGRGSPEMLLDFFAASRALGTNNL